MLYQSVKEREEEQAEEQWSLEEQSTPDIVPLQTKLWLSRL